MATKKEPKRTPSIIPTTGTNPAISPGPRAAPDITTAEDLQALTDGLAGDTDTERDNVPATEPPVEEETETEDKGGPPAPEVEEEPLEVHLDPAAPDSGRMVKATIDTTTGKVVAIEDLPLATDAQGHFLTTEENNLRGRVSVLEDVLWRVHAWLFNDGSETNLQRDLLDIVSWGRTPVAVLARTAPAAPERDPEKFAAFAKFVAHDLTLQAVEAQLGRLVSAGCLTEKRLWETGNPWDTAKKALAKLRDPVQLAAYWPMVCFLRGRALGSARPEALLAASWAVLDVIGEMKKEV